MSNGGTSRLQLVGLGKVTGVHGVRGELKVGSLDSDPELFAALGCVYIGGVRHRVLGARRSKRQVLLTLDGVASRSQAEALVGQEVQGEAGRFPPLAEGEYYWFQVLGLKVLDAAQGTDLGVLAEIIPTPAHDVYVVRQGDREILLPAVEEVIVEVNLNEGFIKVLPPAGLLDA